MALIAIALLIVALARGWPRLVPAPILALGGIYGAQLVVDDAVLDPGAAAVAAGLLLTAELAYWSLEERERIRSETGEAIRRLAYLAALGATAVFSSLVLLALADAFRARGLAIDLLGALAVGAAVVGVWLLARGRSLTSQ
ncbi:MAG: hypothetical protein R6W48_05950 [Gaiellaceae bacterium]